MPRPSHAGPRPLLDLRGEIRVIAHILAYRKPDFGRPAGSRSLKPVTHREDRRSSGRTPSSVGPMLAMKRFSWHYTLVTSFEDGPGGHRLFIVNERESTRNAAPDYSNGFDGTRLPS
jgi:hypothetical protein